MIFELLDCRNYYNCVIDFQPYNVEQIDTLLTLKQKFPRIPSIDALTLGYLNFSS